MSEKLTGRPDNPIPEVGNGAVIEVGSQAVVFTDSFQARLADGSIEFLTPRHVALVAALSAGALVTKDTWSELGYSASSLADTVYFLRVALGMKIRTLRGRGYLILVEDPKKLG